MGNLREANHRPRGAEEPECPEVVRELHVSFSVELPRPRNRPLSRASRASNAEGILRAIVDACQAWLDGTEATHKEKFGDEPEDADSEYSKNCEEVEQFRDACEEAAEAVSGCEFPGMFG